MKMSEAYEFQYKQMISHTLDQYRGKEPLAAFWPVIGNRFDSSRGILVVGKATNGWGPEWSLSDGATPDRLTSAARSKSENTSMSWVLEWSGSDGIAKGYNTNRSAFWRLIKKTILLIEPESASSPDWPHLVAWTNLMKIAPASAGNPSNYLWDVQLKNCMDLLRREYEELQPARVLVLTGRDWYQPFLGALDIEVLGRFNGFVELIGRKDSCRLVFAKHPQGKAGGESELSREVVEAFQNR